MYVSQPAPSHLKRDLFQAQRLCSRLAVEYTHGVEATLLGVHQPSSDGLAHHTNAYSDPVGELVVSDRTEEQRARNIAAANKIDQGYRCLVEALKILTETPSDIPV